MLKKNLDGRVVTLGTICLLLAVALCGSLSSHASRVRPMNLEEMTERAARIFSGRCTEIRTVHDAGLDREVTVVTLEVERSVKGEDTGSVSFRMSGAAGVGARADLPRFAPGERVIVFLYGESATGLTSPVGLGQGKFVVVQDKLGRDLAINVLSNKVLFDRLSPTARATIAASEEHWRNREGIPPDALLDMVEALLP